MRSGALVLAGWVGLIGAGCTPAPVGALLVTNESAKTFYLVISAGRDGSVFYRVDPGARGLASSPAPGQPRKAVVVYSSACEAFLGTSDVDSGGLIIDPAGAVRFEADGALGAAITPLPSDARCRW